MKHDLGAEGIRLYCLVAVIVLVGMSSLSGQTDDQQETDARKGQAAISFQLAGLNLTEFDGGVGVKYWMGESFAFLTAASFDMSGYERLEEGILDSEDDWRSLGLTVGIERHLRVGRLSPYVGAYLGADFGRSENKNIFSDESVSITKTTSKVYAANAAFGIELRVTKNISLAGHYLFGGQFYNDVSRYNHDGETNEYETNYSDIGVEASSIVLSVYL